MYSVNRFSVLIKIMITMLNFLQLLLFQERNQLASKSAVGKDLVRKLAFCFFVSIYCNLVCWLDFNLDLNQWCLMMAYHLNGGIEEQPGSVSARCKLPWLSSCTEVLNIVYYDFLLHQNLG
jgi:hypothetical protein